MALSEDQILRFSRQILLTEVGGIGQARLLGAGAAVAGVGQAQAVAAAYLAAGGTPVSFPDRTVQADEVGFLLGAGDVGRPLGEALAPVLGAVASDASGTAPRGRVTELPATFDGPAPWVALGFRERRGAVLFRSEAGCAECFRLSSAGLSSGAEPGAAAVMMGAVAALVYQRLVLGFLPALGGLWVDEDGSMPPFEVTRCLRCQG